MTLQVLSSVLVDGSMVAVLAAGGPSTLGEAFCPAGDVASCTHNAHRSVAGSADASTALESNESALHTHKHGSGTSREPSGFTTALKYLHSVDYSYAYYRYP